MIIREVLAEEREKYNKAVSHPCQSWEWGEFRKKSGIEVVRIGGFEGERLVFGYQLTIHPVSYSKYTIGYLPRGPMPDKAMINSLQKIGEKRNCIFFKIEPNVIKNKKEAMENRKLELVPSSKPFFYRYTFLIDLTESENKLLKAMKQKTRYNIKIARRHGVKIREDNSDAAFETYLRLMKETTRRQHFFAHTENYHRQMWQTLKAAGIAHLLKAEYQGQTLSCWILFKFHNRLYYPYGASTSINRSVMANNLMMWEAIKLGKKMNCKTFDLWGCLGPNPDPKNSWYGFHRFKAGYGGKLVEFIGSFDLILKPFLYRLYNFVDNWRWRLLKLTKNL